MGDHGDECERADSGGNRYGIGSGHAEEQTVEEPREGEGAAEPGAEADRDGSDASGKH